MLRALFFIGVIVWAVCPGMCAYAQQYVSFHGLGDLPGGDVYSEAARVNDAGQVVGNSHSVNSTTNGSREAYVWTESTGMVALSDIPGGQYWCEALGVNNTGQAVGYGYNDSSDFEAMLWDFEAVNSRIRLGIASGYTDSIAEGINDLGDIVGWNSSSSGLHKAFLIHGLGLGGAMIDLGDLAGGVVRSEGKDVNNAGQVVGVSASGSGLEAFLWTQASGMVGLGDLPGGAFQSWAWGIGENGLVVGESTSSAGTEAFVWSASAGMTALGDLPGGSFGSGAWDINDQGFIVGRSQADGGYQAFLWTPEEGMRSLQSIIEEQQIRGAEGWRLVIARGINAHGDIVGDGRNPNGMVEAFYLKASREPADEDQDGLTDDEEAELGTDPENPDTDGDGLLDGDEVHAHGTDPSLVDTDTDGLTDYDEIQVHGTNPVQPDSDGDGLTDGEEVSVHSTDPQQADTDGDGLSDGDEVTTHGTDPLEDDTDGDGFSDGAEIENGTDPSTPEDTTPPVPVFDSNAPYLTNQASIAVSITFDEYVVGFALDDIQTINASVNGFTTIVAGYWYTFTLAPVLPGYVEVSVPAGVATDVARNGNIESALGWEFDPIHPSCSFQSQAPYMTGQSPIPVTIAFSEYITGFTVNDIQTTNASVSGFTALAPGRIYSVNLVPASGGLVTASVLSGAVTDLAGNPNTDSPTFYRFYSSAPIVRSITQYAVLSGGRVVQYNVQFSEPVLGVDPNDFRLLTTGIVGARVLNVSGFGNNYSVYVDTGNRSGTLQLQLVDTDSIWSYTFTPLGGLGYGNGNAYGPVFSR